MQGATTQTTLIILSEAERNVNKLECLLYDMMERAGVKPTAHERELAAMFSDGVTKRLHDVEDIITKENKR